MAAANRGQVPHPPRELSKRLLAAQDRVIATAVSDHAHLQHPRQPRKSLCKRVRKGSKRVPEGILNDVDRCCTWCWNEWLNDRELSASNTVAIRAAIRQLEQTKPDENTPPHAGVDFAPFIADRFEWGVSRSGTVIHLVDFGTDHSSAKRRGFSDRTFCGVNLDSSRCDPPAEDDRVCPNCARKARSHVRRGKLEGSA